MALEFSDAVRRSPSTPRPAPTRCPRTSRCSASNESPEPPLPAWSSRRRGRWRAQPLSRPHQRRAAPRASATATACPPSTSRSATAPATSCSPRARRCSSRAPSSSTPGRRSASTRTSRRPPGATAITVPLDDGHTPRPRRDGRRDHRGHAAGDRLQPEQPDVDRAARRRHRRLRGEGAAPRLRDRRRGLLRVQHARRPRHDARPARAAPEPRPAADVLEGLRAVRAARRLRAVRLRGAPRAVDQVRQPFFCNAPRRPRRSRRSSTRTRSPSASSARRRAHRARRRLRALGIEAAESQANFCWFRCPAHAEDAARSRRRWCAPRPSAECSSAPAAPSAVRARCASPTARRSRTGCPRAGRAARMSVAVVCDSTSYVPIEQLDAVGVRRVSLYVGWDGGDLKHRGARLHRPRRLLRAAAGVRGSLPQTSQPSVGDFLAVYEPLIAPWRRHRVDPPRRGPVGQRAERPRGRRRRSTAGAALRSSTPETGAGGLGLMVLAAARAARAGAAPTPWWPPLRDARAALEMWLCLDTLEFLRKGGRIGAAQALLGSALQVKPILTFGTEIAPVGRVRTRKRALSSGWSPTCTSCARAGATEWIVQHAQSDVDASASSSRARRSWAARRALHPGRAGPPAPTWVRAAGRRARHP